MSGVSRDYLNAFGLDGPLAINKLFPVLPLRGKDKISIDISSLSITISAKK